MPFKLPRALSFNAYTVALAAAGLGYVSLIAGEAAEATSLVKWIATAAVVTLALSTVLGVLAMGQGAKGANPDTPGILAQAHTLLLLVGLVLAGTLVLNKIWKWSGPPTPTASTPRRR
jgi:hypothetical protein